MKQITKKEILEEFYTDYCMECDDDGETPLDKDQWMKLKDVKHTIKNLHHLFGKIREQSNGKY